MKIFGKMFWLYLAGIFIPVLSTPTLMTQAADEGSLQGGVRLANEIMSTLPEPCCSVLFFKDFHLENDLVLQELSHANGIQIMNIISRNKSQENSTNTYLSEVFRRGRQFRRESWNVVVVVASEELEVLETFATSSLSNRLLVWSSRLIAITSLSQHDLKRLLSNYWTFFMMNTIVLNRDKEGSARWSSYTHMPYTSVGPREVRLAVWRDNGSLQYTSRLQFFPEKFSDFYGATVNITMFDIPPMWFLAVVRAPNGSLVEKVTGSDYLLLQAVAKTLNFTFRRLNVSSTAEVYGKVANREAFFHPMISGILATRLEQYDFTQTYTYIRFIFAMAKPIITPNWLSLYNPLSNYVWLSVLMTTILMPLIYLQVTRSEVLHVPVKEKSIGWTVLMVFGILINQSSHLPKFNASRLAILTWCIFTFIVVTGYKGNLTAHLTLPKYPPRPETVEELVNYADKITIDTYGIEYKKSFKKSGAPVLGKLADLMYVGTHLKDGLQQALTKKQAHLGGFLGMTMRLGMYYTHRDGTPRFYIGKEAIIPGRAAWPIPHDAPFTHNLNWCLQACIEAGLYTKWTEDMLTLVRYENLRKMRQERELREEAGNNGEDMEIPDEDTEDGNRPLTLRHMQGTFSLCAIGIVTAMLVFITEVCLRQKNING